MAGLEQKTGERENKHVRVLACRHDNPKQYGDLTAPADINRRGGAGKVSITGTSKQPTSR